MLKIKINNTFYDVINYEENIEELKRDDPTPEEKPEVLYVYLNFKYTGDLIELRTKIKEQLRENNRRFHLYQDEAIFQTYKGIYLRFVKRNISPSTGIAQDVILCLKTYLED